MTPITHPAFGDMRHGFFTRAGGVSQGIYEGLNCGAGSRDNPDHIHENRARVAAHFGGDQLITLHQIHSADVVVVDGPAPQAQADGMVTRARGVPLGILTADCQPVLFADPTAGVIGAAHAGWKGALGGVLEQVVNTMVGQGAEQARITAVIGPCLSQKNYEVGPEFMETFLKSDPDNTRFFDMSYGERPHFDLPTYGIQRLQNAGLTRIYTTDECTYDDAERFFSYRRSTHRKEADYGRLISVICL